MPTDEQTTSIEESIAESIEEGISSISVDGLSVTATDDGSRLDHLEKLERRQARNSSSSKSHFGLRLTKLIPPGGG